MFRDRRSVSDRHTPPGHCRSDSQVLTADTYCRQFRFLQQSYQLQIMLPSVNFSSTQAVSILNSQEIQRSISALLKSSRSAQCLLHRFFHIRRALGLLCILRLRLIEILTLDDTALLFHLCDIQATGSQAAMLQNIRLDLIIRCLFLGCRQIHLVNLHFDFDMLLYLEFGQKTYRLNGITKDPQSSRQLYQRNC